MIPYAVTFQSGGFMRMLTYLYKSKTTSYKFLFIITFITILAISAMDILQAFLFMIIMNRALGINNYPLWLIVVWGISFVSIYYLVSLLSSYLVTELLKKIRRGLIHDSLNKQFGLQASQFLNSETASSITNFVTSEIDNLISNYFGFVFQLVGVFFTTILGIIYLFYLSFYFVLLIIAAIIVLVLIMIFSQKRISGNYAKVFATSGMVVKLMNNVANFFIVSKMFSYKKFLIKHIDEEYAKYNTQKTKASRYDSLIEKINGGLSLALFIGLYIVAVYLAIKGKMNGGEIVSMIQISSSIISPFFVIAYVIKSMSNTKSTRDKIAKLLKIKDDVSICDNLPIYSLVGNELSYSYIEEKPIFNNLSFNFELGDRIGLIGESGSGKSTFLKMISKIIDNYDGTILINNKINLHDVDDENYFKNVKLLPQEPILLNDSIVNNIVLNNSFDKEKFYSIFNALKLNLSFSDLNLKIDTEKANYSLGEARRICLARILYSNSTFIFLDEPFASLDEENRAIIENVLLSLNNVCLVVSSHVFSDEFYSSLNKKIFFTKQ